MENYWSKIVEESFKNANSLRYYTFKDTDGITDGFALIYDSLSDMQLYGMAGYNELANYPYNVKPFSRRGNAQSEKAKAIVMQLFYNEEKVDINFVGVSSGKVAKIYNLKYNPKELEQFKLNNYQYRHFAFTTGYVNEGKVIIDGADMTKLYLHFCQLISKQPLKNLNQYNEAKSRCEKLSTGFAQVDELNVLLKLICDYQNEHENTLK